MKNLIALLLICTLFVNTAYGQEEEKAKKGKLSGIEKFNNQLKVCTEVLDQKNDKGKPVVSSNARRSLVRYMRGTQRYLEQKRYSNAQSQMDSLFNYQVPEVVSNELKALGEIVDALIKAAKAKQVKEGEALYQKVLDSTKKNMSQDDIDTLKDEIETMRQGMSSSSSSDIAIRRVRKKLDKASRFLGYWGPVASAQSTGDYSQAIEKLESLMSSSSYSILPTKVLRAKAEALRKEAYKNYDTELVVMQKELRKANDSEAVKKVMNKFQVFQNKYSRGMRSTSRYSEMNQTEQALGYWMNVITSEENGDFPQAIQNLHNLESGNYRNTSLLKWADIKAKKASLVKKMLTAPKTDDPIVKAVDEKIKGCKDLKELIAFKAKLQELSNNYSNNRTQELYYLQNDLQILSTMYNAFKSGQYAQVFQYNRSRGQESHRWQDILQKQRDLIRLKSIAALADISEDKLIKKDVALNKIILSMADTAAEKKDWPKLVLILDTYAMAFFPNNRRPVWLDGEINACKSFITAQNFEKAHLLSKAIQQYTFVLQQTGKRHPVKEAIQRLKALKESNPDLFVENNATLPIPANVPEIPED